MRLFNESNGKSFEYSVLGQGKIMQGHALKLIRYAAMHPSKNMSITKIANGTGIARMNIYWLIQDASVRENESVLAKVARAHDFNVQIDDSWNRANKFARTKSIIQAKKVSKKSHAPHMKLKESFK